MYCLGASGKDVRFPGFSNRRRRIEITLVKLAGKAIDGLESLNIRYQQTFRPVSNKAAIANAKFLIDEVFLAFQECPESPVGYKLQLFAFHLSAADD
jgi:hypothetical protein